MVTLEIVKKIQEKLQKLTPTQMEKLAAEGFADIEKYWLGADQAIVTLADGGEVMKKLTYSIVRTTTYHEVSASAWPYPRRSTTINFVLQSVDAPTLTNKFLLSIQQDINTQQLYQWSVVAISILPGGSTAVHLDDGEIGWAALAFVQDVGETVLIVGKLSKLEKVATATKMIKLGKLGDKLGDIQKAGRISDVFLHGILTGTEATTAAINTAGAVQDFKDENYEGAAVKGLDALAASLGVVPNAKAFREARQNAQRAVQNAISDKVDDVALGGQNQRRVARQTGEAVAPGREFASLDQLGQSGKIDPSKVRFSQDSIGATFKNEDFVADLASKLKNGTVDPSSIPPIRLVERDGMIFTLDNRRLKAFQLAGIEIRYQLLDKIPPQEMFKFTTVNDGIDIIIRGQ